MSADLTLPFSPSKRPPPLPLHASCICQFTRSHFLLGLLLAGTVIGNISMETFVDVFGASIVSLEPVARVFGIGEHFQVG